jgi:hypothetical protein
VLSNQTVRSLCDRNHPQVLLPSPVISLLSAEKRQGRWPRQHLGWPLGGIRGFRGHVIDIMHLSLG